MHERRTGDRRIQKTEGLLRGALGTLLHEKPYENIAVKEILHRANVGRSTFYTHFSDKDELLLSCIHSVLGSAQPRSRRPGRAEIHEDVLWFALPVLEHIERHRTERPTPGAQGRQALHEHLRQAITGLVADEITTALRYGRRAAGEASPELLARWIATTFVLTLDWWVESDSPLPARDAEGVFRGLIEPGLAETLR